MPAALALLPLAALIHAASLPLAAPLGAGPSAGAPGALAETGSASDADLDEEIAQGAYLVTRVAMCHECHTPRDPDGELIHTQLLQGAAMPVAAPVFLSRWGFRAPAIAGLPGYSDAEAVRLLTRGITQRGTRPRPPMPQYGFTEDDARAIIAYLRSL